MPERFGKINPLLTAVTACRSIEEGVHARISLIQKGNQIILGSRLLLREEISWF